MKVRQCQRNTGIRLRLLSTAVGDPLPGLFPEKQLEHISDQLEYVSYTKRLFQNYVCLHFMVEQFVLFPVFFYRWCFTHYKGKFRSAVQEEDMSTESPYQTEADSAQTGKHTGKYH